MIVSSWTVVTKRAPCVVCGNGEIEIVDWAQELREYRKARQLTLRQMADNARCSASYIHDLERGTRRLDEAKFKRITGLSIVVYKPWREPAPELEDVK